MEEKWNKSREMLRELKEERMSKALEADRILSYHVKWNQTQGKIHNVLRII